MSKNSRDPFSRPQRLLGEGMLASARRHPEKTALVIEGEPYTYAQLHDASLRLAAALKKRGLQPGDRVAIYMDNTWPAVVSIYGTLLAGGVFFVINPQTKKKKLQFLLQDSEAKLLLTDSHLAKVFLPAVQEQKTASLRSIIFSGSLPPGESAPPIPDITIENFAAVLADSAPLPLPETLPVIPLDLAAFIYTSGSTGEPKAVMQTHQSMVFAAWSLIEYIRLSAHDRIMVVLPFAFDYGLYQLLMTMKLGATLVVERSFTFPALIYKRIREEEATVFPGVPTMFAMMITSHRKKSLCFPTITRVTNTAATLPAQFIPELQEIFPQALIFKMYGLTECKRVSYLEPELVEQKPQSIGKAIPGTEIFLLSPEKEEVPAGKPGILHVRGPHVMAGYWKRPELSAKMLKPGKNPGERILCTHDWCRMDVDGDLYFIGRNDDIIKTRGEKVSPVEVENVLHSIVPGVREAVVIGKDDPLLGQGIWAFLTLEENTAANEKQLKKICLAHLENFMVPQRIIFLEQMPKTANGKIDKKALSALAENEES
ncbi:MAG: long chain acyl-CoA synthetase [Deltaproteobacteria bacterium]|nr:MAG: long chain acyl-CoA synthetase [Deltaproteobacteria bacterium]